jgi:hypothetical protein
MRYIILALLITFFATPVVAFDVSVGNGRTRYDISMTNLAAQVAALEAILAASSNLLTQTRQAIVTTDASVTVTQAELDLAEADLLVLQTASNANTTTTSATLTNLTNSANALTTATTAIVTGINDIMTCGTMSEVHNPNVGGDGCIIAKSMDGSCGAGAVAKVILGQIQCVLPDLNPIERAELTAAQVAITTAQAGLTAAANNIAILDAAVAANDTEIASNNTDIANLVTADVAITAAIATVDVKANNALTRANNQRTCGDSGQVYDVSAGGCVLVAAAPAPACVCAADTYTYDPGIYSASVSLTLPASNCGDTANPKQLVTIGIVQCQVPPFTGQYVQSTSNQWAERLAVCSSPNVWSTVSSSYPSDHPWVGSPIVGQTGCNL